MSPIIGGLVADDLDPAMKQMVELMMGPTTRGGRALSLSGAFAVEGTWNRRDVHAAEIPAANCISNAASWPRCTRPRSVRSMASSSSTRRRVTSLPRSSRRTARPTSAC